MNGEIPARSPLWLILTQYYPPEIGAPQIRLRCMVRELRRHGIRVEVLTAMPNYPTGQLHPGYERKFWLRETLAGVQVRRTWVYAATGRKTWVRLANYLSFTATSLLSALGGPKPDVLFVESQPLTLGLVAVLMKWLRGVRYIYNVPDLQVDVARHLGFLRNPALLRAMARTEDLFLRRAWKVSTVTHQFIEHFIERGLPRQKITFLPNGSDVQHLRPMPPSDRLLRRWGLAGKKIFLYVGTHAYYHGLDTLLDAAALLRGRHDIVFLMVGAGPERERLRRRAAQMDLHNVVFGESPYEEMAELYSIAHASVAMLRDIDVAKKMRLSKVFPSLSCAVPVIYSGKGEAADLLTSTRTGVSVPPENPPALRLAVEWLADARGERTGMGAAGRRLVEKEYSWSVIVDRWLAEIYNGPGTGVQSMSPSTDV